MQLLASVLHTLQSPVDYNYSPMQPLYNMSAHCYGPFWTWGCEMLLLLPCADQARTHLLHLL